MKTCKLLIAACALALAGIPFANAAAKAPSTPLPINVSKMTGDLELTSDQVNKLRKIVTEQKKDFEAVNKLSGDERTEAGVKAREKTRDKIIGILTAEQKEKWGAKK